jgi:hypothetical protein
LITRSKTTLAPIDSIDIILCLAEELLRLSDIGHKQVRLLGLALSNLKDEHDAAYVQLELQLRQQDEWLGRQTRTAIVD